MTKEEWLKKVDAIEKKANDVEALLEKDYKELGDMIDFLEDKIIRLEAKFKKAVSLEVLKKIEEE